MARVGWAAWAGLWASACGRREASGGWLGQRLSGLQGRPGRKRRKRNSELKIGFLNLPRLWKFAQGDLGEILTWGFFLNSSKLLKDFRKNIICHAMQCILYKIYFWKGFSYVLQIDMHLICAPMLTKFYSCKKWVLHTSTSKILVNVIPFSHRPSYHFKNPFQIIEKVFLTLFGPSFSLAIYMTWVVPFSFTHELHIFSFYRVGWEGAFVELRWGTTYKKECPSA
jgi:hypothetical protein